MATATTAIPSFLGTRRGKLTLALLCAIAFLDFVDASIVNVALPAIRHALHFSVQNLQWVPSGYLLTYGGFMLLGGRAADLLGRRRVLACGTALIGVASLFGGLAGSAGMLIAARLAQGMGAAMMAPAALSILTTTFADGRERHTALGVWGGIGGLASAVGVLLGGLLTAGPGWRWVMFVNPVAAVLVLGGIFRLISGERRHAQLAGFDFPGAILATGGMLLLVYALVKASAIGWGNARTIGEISAAVALLVAFVINELRHRNPLAPLSIFRINGLGFSNITQLTAVHAECPSLLTDPDRSLLSPAVFRDRISAGISSQLLSRVGTRPVIVTGALIAAVGMYWLSRIPVHGTYLNDLLPGMLVLAVGFGPVFVGVTTAANAGVPADKSGLAASLLNASQQLGGVLGLAVFTSLATSRTHHLLETHTLPATALTAGFQRALLAGSIFILAAAIIALRATNTRGETDQPDTTAQPEASTVSRNHRREGLLAAMANDKVM
jgi:MFS family permease